jgi:hypothetical protein
MTRLNWHTFTMPESPVFGWEDPFYDPADPATVPPLTGKTLTPWGPECSNEEKTNGNRR